MITHSFVASSNFARVRTFETSEPAFGSEAQNAATLMSSGVPKQRGIHSPICSPEPWPKIAATPSAVPMIAMPMPASPQNSSSLTIGSPRPVGSAKNCARPSKPYSPIFAASWMIGHGVSSRSSHSCAAGRITSAAKPCTQSRMSFWSWVSCSEKVTSWPAAPVIASTAASAASVLTSVVVDIGRGGSLIGMRVCAEQSGEARSERELR